MSNFFKSFEIFLKWCKNQEFVLIEFVLFQHFKGDMLYIVYIQILKLVFSIGFNVNYYKRIEREYEQWKSEWDGDYPAPQEWMTFEDWKKEDK